MAVEQAGKLIANIPCRGEPVSELGPDLFDTAGLREDPTPFELP